jgi:polar amino acid transport system substrate-binding protein
MRSLALLALVLFAVPLRAAPVTIIAEDDWYPYSARVDGGPKGMAVDLVRAAYQAAGQTVAFDVMNYDQGKKMVRDGAAIGVFDAPRTGRTEGVYRWHSTPLFSGSCYVYTRRNFAAGPLDLAGLSGKRVGVTAGYEYTDPVDSDTRMIRVVCASDTDLVAKLLSHQVDYILLFDKVADHLEQKLHIRGHLRQNGQLGSLDLYIAFSKAHPRAKAACDHFSRGLETIKKDGRYAAILSKWAAH